MKAITSIVTLLLIAGCATSTDTQEVEAVRDFVAVSRLQEVDQIRLYQQMHYTYLNDHYVAVPARRDNYLVEFRSQCRALTRRDFTPEMVDIRHDPSYVRAKFDTIRGCRIHRIYEVSEEQLNELKALGDAPGDEVYLPAEE